MVLSFTMILALVYIIFIAAIVISLATHHKRVALALAVLVVVSLIVLAALWTMGGDSGSLTEMQTFDNGEYVAIRWEGRTYVPYCPVDSGVRGAQIGYVDGDRKDQVFEYKDYSPEEWIISYYHSGEMDACMLMREENVTEIPDGLESEYPWN